MPAGRAAGHSSALPVATGGAAGHTYSTGHAALPPDAAHGHGPAKIPVLHSLGLTRAASPHVRHRTRLRGLPLHLVLAGCALRTHQRPPRRRRRGVRRHRRRSRRMAHSGGRARDRRRPLILIAYV